MAGNDSSYKAIAWAWEVRLATPSQKLVLLSLACHADQEFSCWPALSRIADDTGLDKSTVTRALAALEEAGILIREPQKRTNGSPAPTRYYLCHPEAGEVAEAKGVVVTGVGCHGR